MPNFPKNTSSFMKYSEKGSTFPFKTDEAKNLLKAVPNKEAYNKLSNQDKKGFDKAAKEAGLPTKKASIAKKIEKIPTLPPKKLNTKASFHGQTGPSRPDEKMNRRYS